MTEEWRDLQYSLLIHFIALLLLTAYFAYNSKETVKQKKLAVPVRLVSVAKKPSLNSGLGNKSSVASKKSEGTTNKIVKPVKPKPILSSNQEIKKTESKPVAKQVEKTKQTPQNAAAKTPTAKKTNVKQQNAKNKTAVKTSQTANKEVAKPSNDKLKTTPTKSTPTEKKAVVQKPVETKPTIVKPSHTKPIFEKNGDYTVEPAKNSELFAEVSDSMLSIEPESIFEPDSVLDGDLPETMPANFEPENTGIEEPAPTGAGEFEIGSIEAFGGNNEKFVPPSILKRVMPEYPEWARSKGVHGNVAYRVLILPSGTVGDVVTMSSTIDPRLALTGSQALRRWVFTPVLINGEPQETWVKLTVQYELN